MARQWGMEYHFPIEGNDKFLSSLSQMVGNVFVVMSKHGHLSNVVKNKRFT